MVWYLIKGGCRAKVVLGTEGHDTGKSNLAILDMPIKVFFGNDFFTGLGDDHPFLYY